MALTPQAVITAVVLAVLVTVLSALLPAVRAAHTPPVAALREATTPVERPGRVRSIIGGVLAVIALAGLGMAFADDPSVSLVALAALLLLLATVLLAPLLAKGTAHVAAGVMRVGGVSGHLAGRNAERGPRRIAATASAESTVTSTASTTAVITACGVSATPDVSDRPNCGRYRASSTWCRSRWALRGSTARTNSSPRWVAGRSTPCSRWR